ncbi:hypothetical protein [Cyanothece sp. BG0011]|uniref:hypothetical protein n=1 Tax=Cyanothece sp. BG0011 TaxID=2082950 RepID=UPI000D1E65DD|nr:hypothetical protein [Cyanothece sp. BG0011]
MVRQFNGVDKKQQIESDKKLDTILALVSKEKSLTTKILEFSEKLVIPLLLLLLSGITGLAGYQVSTAQNKLTDAQLELARVQRRENLQTKYVELFYQEITSQDIQKQKNAVSFLEMMSPHVDEPIMILIWAKNKVQPEVKSEIETAIQNIRNLYPQANMVSEYKIQIFYNGERTEQKTIAFEIKEALRESSVTSVIEVKPQRDRASSDQIRYYPQNEGDVANALQTILARTYPERHFKLQTVYTPSPGSISIFLKTDS